MKKDELIRASIIGTLMYNDIVLLTLNIANQCKDKDGLSSSTISEQERDSYINTARANYDKVRNFLVTVECWDPVMVDECIEMMVQNGDAKDFKELFDSISLFCRQARILLQRTQKGESLVLAASANNIRLDAVAPIVKSINTNFDMIMKQLSL